MILKIQLFIKMFSSQEFSSNKLTITINQELDLIPIAKVFSNIDSGVLYANVVSSTTMTNSNVYYYVWNGTVTDPTKLDQINYVKKYFTDLGYGVAIKTNTSSNNTITWNISW